MKEQAKKITIKDVARMAGVSKGTVDRVLHNRGEVSQASKERVLEVIRKIDYKPNIYASMLASKKSYRFVCLIPGFRPGEYWEMVHKDIQKAIERTRNFSYEIEVVFYNQFELESFRDACRKVLETPPDAVLLAPIFRDSTVAFTAELGRLQIPFVYIDSKIDHTNYLAYFGMPLYESGYLAASLLLKHQQVTELANFRLERGGGPQDNPTLARREGFLTYVKENNPDLQIYNAFLKPYDPVQNLRTLDTFFDEHPDVKHIVMFNSRVHLISEYLESHGLHDKVVLGYDLLGRNIEGLKKGVVDYIIAQRTETQVYRGIMAMIEYFAFKKSPVSHDNFMSLDIITKDNLTFYFDVQEF
ncbi:MAG: LacI family DNA-binding transcriptional regulator [Rikenellaceae bacterium]|nr:LacI family DNA-binding transcriptional regulator [Rikenellaceae bacterium]